MHVQAIRRPAPPGADQARRLHLASAGADHATHRLTEDASPAASNSWAAVPLGVPLPGGLDELANQTLSFELPVTEDVRFAGAVTARLRFSSTEIDSFVLARLSRIDAAGTAHQLSLGAVRPVARAEDAARSTTVEIAIDPGRREPLVPHEPVVLRFSLTPGPVLLRAGETLRLDLASRTDLVRKDPGEGYPQFDLPVPPYLARNTVHFGGESWVDLTVVPSAPSRPDGSGSGADRSPRRPSS